jgi:putative radical SAM enzyme (TIGR03279 family)
MPRGLRPSLYVKDEDYRHSFLYGNYVTLSNVSLSDLARIRELHLSPLYISVHATAERVRQKLLGRTRALPILPLLKKLSAAGIVLHTQAVICPGLNDGRVLEKTVRDLSRLHPQVRSLALVPVGLSGHRAGLAPLTPVDTRLAKLLVGQVEAWQTRFRAELGSRFVYATDEWYLRAGSQVPAAAAYEGANFRTVAGRPASACPGACPQRGISSSPWGPWPRGWWPRLCARSPGFRVSLWKWCRWPTGYSAKP